MIVGSEEIHILYNQTQITPPPINTPNKRISLVDSQYGGFGKKQLT